MASMLATGLAAQDLGFDHGSASGSDLTAQLDAQLAEQRKKRQQGASPAENSMQFMPSAAADLYNTGAYGALGGR